MITNLFRRWLYLFDRKNVRIYKCEQFQILLYAVFGRSLGSEFLEGLIKCRL